MMAAGASLWIPTSSAPQLASGEVHIWRFPLRLLPGDLSVFNNYLSPDEVARAARLLDYNKRDEFIFCRGRLRQILATYLRCSPALIGFGYGPYGKPALRDSQLFFNLSHAGRWALLALSLDGEVGVDIERIDLDVDYAKMTTCFFSTEENLLLGAISLGRRRRSFYRLWTRKEALWKGAGGGFSAPALAMETPWQVRSLWVTSGYVAALASCAQESIIHRFDFFPLEGNLTGESPLC